ACPAHALQRGYRQAHRPTIAWAPTRRNPSCPAAPAVRELACHLYPRAFARQMTSRGARRAHAKSFGGFGQKLAEFAGSVCLSPIAIRADTPLRMALAQARSALLPTSWPRYLSASVTESGTFPCPDLKCQIRDRRKPWNTRSSTSYRSQSSRSP